MDDAGRPDFGALQNRMHRTGPEVPAAGRRRSRSPTWSSTCCRWDGEDLARPARTPSAGSGWTRWRWPGTAGWPRRGSAAAGRGVHAASQENGLEGVVAKRLTSPYRAGRAQPRLAQGQELPHAVGRRRRLAARAGPAGRRDRARCCSASRTTRAGWSTPGTSAPASPTRTCADLQRMLTARTTSPFDGDAAARGHPRRALGRARPGGRGRLRGVDGGRPAAAPVVAGRAGRPGARRRGGRSR